MNLAILLFIAQSAVFHSQPLPIQVNFPLEGYDARTPLVWNGKEITVKGIWRTPITSGRFGVLVSGGCAKRPKELTGLSAIPTPPARYNETQDGVKFDPASTTMVLQDFIVHLMPPNSLRGCHAGDEFYAEVSNMPDEPPIREVFSIAFMLTATTGKTWTYLWTASAK